MFSFSIRPIIYIYSIFTHIVYSVPWTPIAASATRLWVWIEETGRPSIERERVTLLSSRPVGWTKGWEECDWTSAKDREREHGDVSKLDLRQRERMERERDMTGLRGERTILSNEDSQPQPIVYYNASMEGDTLELLAAAQDCFPCWNLVLLQTGFSTHLVWVQNSSGPRWICFQNTETSLKFKANHMTATKHYFSVTIALFGHGDNANLKALKRTSWNQRGLQVLPLHPGTIAVSL